MRLFLLVVLTMIAFAANSVLNRIALADTWIGPASFATVRLAAGAVVLFLLIRLRSSGVRLSLSPVNLVSASGLLVYMVGFSFAYLTLDTGIGALLLFGGVQVTMFAGALAQGQRPASLQWVGTALAFSGLVYLLWPGSTAPDIVGALLMAAAAVGWGVYSLVGRRVTDPLRATARNFIVALPFAAAVLLAVLLSSGGEVVTPFGLVLALLSGGVMSGLGYSLWYHVLPLLQTSVAAIAQLTVPLIAMLGGFVFLGEPVTSAFLVAAVLVSAGVGLSVWADQRR